MDATELRSLQAPIKERYKFDPEAALITLKAKGSLDNDKVETGRALAVAGLHPASGGSGLGLCSGDMLLEALVACAGVTLKSVATAIEVALRQLVFAEGDLDFRGTLGVDKEAPVGFAEIRLRFELDTDAPQDARVAVKTQRTLLRGLSNDQERPKGFGDYEAGVSRSGLPRPRGTPGHKQRVCSGGRHHPPDVSTAHMIMSRTLIGAAIGPRLSLGQDMVWAASRRCESVTFVEVSPNISLEVHHSLRAILGSLSPELVER